MANTAHAEGIRTGRVLVFAVDDGCLCIDLDWVEAVYQRADVSLHTLKEASGVSRAFLTHQEQPALVVDLREAFDLSDLLGVCDRAAFMVIRASAFLIAVPVDAFLGVRELDLRTRTPVPASLLRDGGFSAGHLVELDGRPHALLEPSRILSTSLRERLEPLLNEAHGFCDRRKKLTALIATLKREPTVAGLKTYARLTRRNGSTRAAAAARQILKVLQESELSVNGDGFAAASLGADTLLRDLVRLSTARQTGEVRVQLPGGSAVIYFDAGRIADACVAGEWGRGACKRIVAAQEGSYRFVPSDIPIHPQRIDGATLWVLVETIEQLAGERRGGRAR